jgi:hypothetical protein
MAAEATYYTIVQSQIVAIVGSMAHSPTDRRRQDTRDGLKHWASGFVPLPRRVMAVGVRGRHAPLPYEEEDAPHARARRRGPVHGHGYDRGCGRVPAHVDNAAGDHRALSRAHDFP